ncbi:MAG: RkpR, polysaccharide export protein [Hyphomicrobiaceae bacterium]
MLNKLPQTRNRTQLPFLADETVPMHGDGALTPAADVAHNPQRQRRRALAWTLLLFVALPTLLASLYYGLIASNQYAVEVRFAVRSSSGAQSSDLLGIFSGIPAAAGSTVTDSYIVIDYIQSRELIDKLEARIDLKKIYARADADYLSRFDSSLSAEEFVKYWRKMFKASFDSASQVVAIEVKAFTAEEAKLVATSLLEASEELINDLSVRARSDAVKNAQQEVKRMEDRLKLQRTALRSFRDTEQEFDPTKQAESRYAILAKLEEELTRARARRSNLQSFMSKDAPSLIVLNSEIAALERQLLVERAKLGKGPEGELRTRDTLGGLVANYEELVVDREFAEKAYVSALSSLERARIEADRQQRYVAAFVRPTLPQEPLYPKRILAICTVLGISLVLWALGVLMVYAIRDHAL